jgi:hypothetical protein
MYRKTANLLSKFVTCFLLEAKNLHNLANFYRYDIFVPKIVIVSKILMALYKLFLINNATNLRKGINYSFSFHQITNNHRKSHFVVALESDLVRC